MGSEEWDLAAIPMHQYFNLDENMFSSSSNSVNNNNNSNIKHAGKESGTGAGGVESSNIKEEGGSRITYGGLPLRKRRAADGPADLDGQNKAALSLANAEEESDIARLGEQKEQGEGEREISDQTGVAEASTSGQAEEREDKKIVEDELAKYKRPRRGSLEVIQAILQVRESALLTDFVRMDGNQHHNRAHLSH